MRFVHLVLQRTAPGLFAAIASLLLAQAALARPVPVRSGEHDGFSRLVLDLPAPLGWTITEAEREAKIVLSGPQLDFDTSDAFRRLTTARLLGIAPLKDGNGLALSLGCNCELTAYRIGAGMLVIDIAGTPEALALPPSPLASHVPPPPPEAEKQPRRSLMLQPGFGLNLPFPQPAPAKPVPEPHSPEAKIPPPEIDHTALVAEAERRLAEQLGRAVVQGLVTPRVSGLPRTNPIDETVEPQVKSEGTPDPAPEPVKEAPLTPGLNLHAETSADRDFADLLDTVKTAPAEPSCLFDHDLDITAWGNDQPFGAQVGPLRARLVGEFDRPDAATGLALARLYIHFGFGAEALQVLRNSPLPEKDSVLLTQLAEIVEFGHARAEGPLTGQQECDSSVALWATLAENPIPPGTFLQEKAILRTLSALPPHLRRHVGPGLSARILAHGNGDLADRILRIVERGEEQPSPATHLAQAGLDLAQGEHEAAADALSSVVEANTELSPEALIRLIDTQIASGTPIDRQLAGLAGAYAHEYRKAPIGAELKRIHVLSLAESGDYDEAFGEIAAFSNVASPGSLRLLRSHAMAALARDAGDVPFLKFALDPDAGRGAAIDRAAANEVAERLLALGFPIVADTFLRTPSEETEAERKRRLLRARAAIEQAKPRRAEADLLGLAGNDADTLRAEARSLSGDHEKARMILAQLENQQGVEREAWLASDWAALRGAENPLISQAAQLSAKANADAGPASSGLAGPLARNRAMLEESSQARATIEALLNGMPIPQEP